MMITSSKRSQMLIGALVVAIVFFALRLPGIHLPYHQDEWKNVSSAETMQAAGQFYAHPPFMQMIFVADYKIFGVAYFRVLPLLFSIGAAILLYFVLKKRLGMSAAGWGTLLFAVCFYNVLGSLQPDVDGAMLPFFFLLSVFAYDRLPGGKKWLALLIATIMCGMLVKLNFALAACAIAADYLWTSRHDRIFSKAVLSASLFVGFGAVYIALLYIIEALYPAFSISFMMGHANQYAGGGRDMIQVFVQGIKALYYLSPLLLVPLCFMSKEEFKKTRVFWLYLAAGFVFYFVLFDFSRAALDKYLMFAIVPLAAISGTVLAGAFKGLMADRKLMRRGIAIGVAVSAVLVAANFLPQEVVALYPKTAWFSRVLHGHWNVLTPLNGGSGPLGFYMSFLFIAGSYIAACAAVIAGFFKKAWRPAALVVVLMIGLAYNVVFAEELLFGKINGSAPALLAQAAAFMAHDPAVSAVLTYNDIGAGPLSMMGKYAGRIYATPSAEDGYRKKFAAFNGQYLIIDIPRFDPAGFYYDFFSKCRPLFRAVSGQISGSVYDCPQTASTTAK